MQYLLLFYYHDGDGSEDDVCARRSLGSIKIYISWLCVVRVLCRVPCMRARTRFENARCTAAAATVQRAEAAVRRTRFFFDYYYYCNNTAAAADLHDDIIFVRLGITTRTNTRTNQTRVHTRYTLARAAPHTHLKTNSEPVRQQRVYICMPRREQRVRRVSEKKLNGRPKHDSRVPTPGSLRQPHNNEQAGARPLPRTYSDSEHYRIIRQPLSIVSLSIIRATRYVRIIVVINECIYCDLCYSNNERLSYE